MHRNQNRGNETLRIHDFVDEGLGHSSYLVELGDGIAAMIDPPRFPAGQESLAERLGLRIAWTFDTHSHADYVTGSPALAARLGATFVAPAASRLETPHRPVLDGERVALSDGLDVVAWATPGHTPDHHGFVLYGDGVPRALFSGGSLMVGAVGRTDLCGPELAEPMARAMFRSLHDKLLVLPDDLPVYPTHGAGSFCSAPAGSEQTTTIGRERMNDPLLAIEDEDEFVERLLAGLGTFPTYFARLPELNRRGPRRYDTVPPLPRLDLAEFRARMAAGATVIDVRPMTDYARGHVRGSVSDALRPVFASWLGWLIDLDKHLLFILDDRQDRVDLVRQCLDVGHEHVAGELDGGMATWTAAGLPVDELVLVDADHLHHSLIDVRQATEYASGHVPSAVNIELAAIAGATVPDGPVTVMCGHGERAMTAASVLAAAGRRGVSVLDGGPDDWAAHTGRALEVGS
jgi:glyoxylase-like metal-dependent hydrolase (beta-lactamase superfamily II)/rhodanese-related sulfurtransferase